MGLMKKLAIMFVMLLGSVATMQAQSFDFSCHDDITDGNTGNDFGTVFTDISDQFSAEEVITIETAGYVFENDTNGNEILVQYVLNPFILLTDGVTRIRFNGSIRMSARFGTFYNDDGDQREGASRGPWAYHIIGIRGAGSNDYSNDLDEVISLLLAAIPTSN